MPDAPYTSLGLLYCVEHWLWWDGASRDEKIRFIDTLWSITAKNTDCSTGPLACPFARSLAPLTCSLAPNCSLRSRPPLRSLVRSLAHFAHSFACGTVNDWMAILSVFFFYFRPYCSFYISTIQRLLRFFHPPSFSNLKLMAHRKRVTK